MRCLSPQCAWRRRLTSPVVLLRCAARCALVRLHNHAFPGELRFDSSRIASSTVTVWLRKSTGRRAQRVELPHRMPVEIAVITMITFRADTSASSRPNSSGVRDRVRRSTPTRDRPKAIDRSAASDSIGNRLGAEERQNPLPSPEVHPHRRRTTTRLIRSVHRWTAPRSKSAQRRQGTPTPRVHEA